VQLVAESALQDALELLEVGAAICSGTEADATNQTDNGEPSRKCGSSSSCKAWGIIEYNKAQCYRKLPGKLDMAVEYYQKAKFMFECNKSCYKDDEGTTSVQYASVFCGMGLAVRGLALNAKAAENQKLHDEKLGEALDLFKKMGAVHDEAVRSRGAESIDTVDHANHFKSWGTILVGLKEFEKASELLSKAKQIFENCESTQNNWYADTLTWIIDLEQQRGSGLDELDRKLEEVESLFRAIGTTGGSQYDKYKKVLDKVQEQRVRAIDTQ